MTWRDPKSGEPPPQPGNRVVSPRGRQDRRGPRLPPRRRRATRRGDLLGFDFAGRGYTTLDEDRAEPRQLGLDQVRVLGALGALVAGDVDTVSAPDSPISAVSLSTWPGFSEASSNRASGPRARCRSPDSRRSSAETISLREPRQTPSTIASTSVAVPARPRRRAGRPARAPARRLRQRRRRPAPLLARRAVPASGSGLSAILRLDLDPLSDLRRGALRLRRGRAARHPAPETV